MIGLLIIFWFLSFIVGMCFAIVLVVCYWTKKGWLRLCRGELAGFCFSCDGPVFDKGVDKKHD